MKRKERILTIYFDADDPVYNKLMDMNKFSRAEYIRTALREAVVKGMMMTVSTDGIKVVYADNMDNKQSIVTSSMQTPVIKSDNKQIELKGNKSIDFNKNTVINTEKIKETVELEENSDPFSII